MSQPKMYSLPGGCSACGSTLRAFEYHGVEPEIVDATLPENKAFLESLNMLQMPAVFWEGEQWTGFRPDKIKAIASRLSAEKERQ